MRFNRIPIAPAAATTTVMRALPPFIGTPAWFAWLESMVLVTLITTHPAVTVVLRYERHGSTPSWYLYTDRPDRGRARRLAIGPTIRLTRLHLATLLAATLPGVPATITLAELPTTSTAPTTLFPLLMTKLQMPHVRMVTLVVPAQEQISAALTVPLTLVSAPAGAGKTTLVAQWLTTAAHPVAWLTLDDADAESARLWTYILAALDPFLPGLLYELQPLVQDPPATWLPVVLNRCLGMTAPLVLVLDDAQRLSRTSPALTETLTFFVDHLPRHLHLVLLCRQPPSLPFARWRVQGRLLELPAAAFHIPVTEAARLLVEQGLKLAPAEVQQLDSQITGWLSGWQLVAEALRRWPDQSHWLDTFTGTRTITDYFQEEVLAGLAPATVTFLLQTAILERLTAPLCDALLDTSGSQAQLDDLAHAHLFLDAVDEPRQIYCYHPLFARFLRHRLQQEHPDLVPVLTMRASTWYATQGDQGKAVAYAAQAGDPLAFAQTLETSSGFFLQRGQLATLHRWLAQVPAAVLVQYPHLGVLAAYCGQGQRHPVSPPKLPALTLQQTRPEAARECQTLRGELLAYHALRLAMLGKVDQSHTAYHQVCTHLPADHPLRNVLLLDLGRVLFQQGHLCRAHALLEVLHQRSTTGDTNPFFAAASTRYLTQIAFIAGDLAAVLQGWQERRAGVRADDTVVLHAVALYERNELELATRVVRPCLADTVSPRTVALALGLLALIQAAQGETARAQQLLAHALARAAHTNAATQMLVGLVALRLYPLGEASAMAETVWEQHQGALTGTPTVLRRYLPIVQARLALLRGAPQGALDSLDPVVAPLRAAGYQRYVLDALIIQAMAYQALDQHDAARCALREAFDLAAPAGWLRPFLDAGPSLQRLMTTEKATLPPFGWTVLGAFRPAIAPAPRYDMPQPATPTTTSVPLIDPLTKREGDIVRHLMQGDSNEQMARVLGISVGTAKRHVSNIYRKLGVKSRTQAIHQIQALHLLGEANGVGQTQRQHLAERDTDAQRATPHHHTAMAFPQPTHELPHGRQSVRGGAGGR